MKTAIVRIAHRFHGPPRSGNGGYTCGITARYLPSPAGVKLFAPPPLETDLELQYTDNDAKLVCNGEVIAAGQSKDLELKVPTPPSYEEAMVATRSFPGIQEHPFPGCFVCGPKRSRSDGLCIFPGKLKGRDLYAAPWVPDNTLANQGTTVSPEFLWAALDCPGAFSLFPLPADKALVLGELTVSIQQQLTCNESCVVCGWHIASQGRKRYAGSAVFTAAGELVAMARATWIEIPLADWR